MGPQAVAAASTTRLHAVQRDQMELLLDRQGAVGGRSLPSAAASTSRRLDGFAWCWRVSTQALARCSVQILSFSSELNSLRRVSHNSHYRCTLFCFVCLCFFFYWKTKIHLQQPLLATAELSRFIWSSNICSSTGAKVQIQIYDIQLECVDICLKYTHTNDRCLLKNCAGRSEQARFSDKEALIVIEEHYGVYLGFCRTLHPNNSTWDVIVSYLSNQEQRLASLWPSSNIN